MGFSSQEYWSGLPFSFLGDLPNHRNWTWISCGQILCTIWEAQIHTCVCVCVCVCAHVCHAVLNCFSCVQFFVTLWAVDCQAPLSMGFSRHKYQSGWPCPPPGDLPDPGIEPSSLMSSALAGGFFTTSTTWEAYIYTHVFGSRISLPFISHTK